MKHLFLLNLLTIIALLTACQKIDVGDPVDDTPVFFADFTVDGIENHWKAGVDDFFMFTGFEKGTDDVFVFTGELKKEVCGNACESLKIYFRDLKVLVQGDPALAEALKIGSYEFAVIPKQDTIWQFTTDTTYTLHLNASPSIFPSAANGQYSWQLPNGLTATGLKVVFDSMDFQLPMPVTLTVAANNATCYGSQTRSVEQTSNASPLGTSCSVQIVPDPDSSLLFAVATGGTGLYSYQWSTGATDPQIFIPILNPTQNSFSVTVTDANGCTSSASVTYLNNPGTLPQICSAGFDYQLETIYTKDSTVANIVAVDSLQLGKVILEYTDALGVNYRSDWANQNQAAFFEIQSVEDFGENEQGQQTKKLKVAFSCQLAGANLMPGVMIIEGTGVFAVAYPD